MEDNRSDFQIVTQETMMRDEARRAKIGTTRNQRRMEKKRAEKIQKLKAKKLLVVFGLLAFFKLPLLMVKAPINLVKASIDGWHEGSSMTRWSFDRRMHGYGDGDG